MSLIVKKYGGSVLESPQKIREHAQILAKDIQAGNQCIIVISALKGTTDQLTELAYEVSSSPNRRELDMLVSTGERVSMSLMSMALQDFNCSAISFTGSQAGILTSHSHSDAEIIGVKPQRVIEALKTHQVVVLAGFQGVHPESREITTLGRGGTDSTAVAIADALQAKHCEIIKDVEGLCSADPKIVNSAHHLSELNYQLLHEMCFYGSKVLHLKAALMAQQKSVPLRIGQAQHIHKGTFVSDQMTTSTQEQILSINSHEHVHTFAVKTDSASEGLNLLRRHLTRHQLPNPTIIASAFENSALRLMITSTEQELSCFSESLKLWPEAESLQSDLCSVTATCNQSPSVELVHKCSLTLQDKGIPFQKMITSNFSVTFYLSKHHREDCIRELHQLVAA